MWKYKYTLFFTKPEGSLLTICFRSLPIFRQKMEMGRGSEITCRGSDFTNLDFTPRRATKTQTYWLVCAYIKQNEKKKTTTEDSGANLNGILNSEKRFRKFWNKISEKNWKYLCNSFSLVYYCRFVSKKGLVTVIILKYIQPKKFVPSDSVNSSHVWTCSRIHPNVSRFS